MESPAATRKSRSGSETRQKKFPISVRLSEVEIAEAHALAEQSGLEFSSYVRSRILAKPTTRSRRRPLVDVQALTRLQGEVNKVGNNIFQLRRLVSFGGTPLGDEIDAAFAGYREVIAAIMETLGRVPK